MRTRIFAALLAGTLAGTCWAEVKDVDEVTGKQWLNYALPLPHEIAIKKENVVSPGDIGIKASENAGDIEKTAIAELKQFLKDKTGVEPNGNKFEILIGVLDKDDAVQGVKVADAARLKTLPHKDQAYLVQPVGDDKLVLAALDPKGVCYAALTLRQLLNRQIDKAAVAVPLATIVDWPDMDQRGAWNIAYATPGFIPWMASMKLNFTHCWPGIILKKGVPAACSPLPLDLMKQASDRALSLVPHVPHFDYWWKYGLNKLYPEAVGKGDGARNPCYAWGGEFPSCRCPCMATPTFTRLLTEWTESAAAQGATEISFWLSERTPCQCECAACLKDGRKQFQKETQAAVDAIMAARKKYPNLKGRIFFTLGNNEAAEDTRVTRECLALVPPEIRVESVYGMNKVFGAFAAKGNWIVSYDGPRVGPGIWTLRYATDWTRTLAKKYYDAKYSGLYCLGKMLAPLPVGGYWEKAFGGYQYAALAEWTWNLKGRDPRQFAEAWATVNGVSDPTRFADWIDTIGPVEDFVANWMYFHAAPWQKAAAALNDPKAAQAWVATLPKPTEFQDMFARCDRALAIAEKIDDQPASLETQYLRTYLTALEQFRDLCSRKTPETVAAFIASLDALDKGCDKLMDVPAVDPKLGPQKSKDNHKAWTQALREKVNAAGKR